MSLLQRINKGGPNSLQHTNNQNNNNQNNGRNNNRFGNRNNNQNNQNNNTPPPDPNRYIVNVKVPCHRTVVQCSMGGLGDPFYRIMGQEMNPAMGDPKALVAALEAGGDAVTALCERLDADWAGYDLHGAALVYSVNRNLQTALTKPAPVPQANDSLDWLENQSGEQAETEKTTQADNPLAVTVLRATDPALTLNVLGRARTQVLTATAPLVFGYQYIMRVVATDDPRLVALAQATGSIQLTG